MTDELLANDNAISLQAAYESGRASRDAEVEALKAEIESLKSIRLTIATLQIKKHGLIDPMP